MLAYVLSYRRQNRIQLGKQVFPQQHRHRQAYMHAQVVTILGSYKRQTSTWRKLLDSATVFVMQHQCVTIGLHESLRHDIANTFEVSNSRSKCTHLSGAHT